MLVSSISGYVDILLETVKSLRQNVEIPHYEDGEDVPSLLWDQFPIQFNSIYFSQTIVWCMRCYIQYVYLITGEVGL